MKVSLDLRTLPVSPNPDPDSGFDPELNARMDAFLAAADAAISRSLSPDPVEFLRQHKQSAGE
jgi:hypothetical protein